MRKSTLTPRAVCGVVPSSQTTPQEAVSEAQKAAHR